jgi:hypothetical protein
MTHRPCIPPGRIQLRGIPADPTWHPTTGWTRQTLPCAAPSQPRRRVARLWLTHAACFGAGALVTALLRMVGVLVVVAVVAGCDLDRRDEWTVEPGGLFYGGHEGDTACRWGSMRVIPTCFPCRTTDYVEARRVCDANGIRKAGTK